MAESKTAPPGPGKVTRWLLACRPKTLTAAISPVLIGTAVALHEQPSTQLAWPVIGATLAGASLLQIGSNFANDVFDYEKGADTHERLGPTRAVQAGLVSARAMKWGMAVVFGLALLVGFYLTSVAGWPIVVVGLASIVAAIAYTGGPYPLGYNGLGDLFVLFFFGWVAVLGTAYVHLGRVPLWAWGPATAVGLAAANILVVNNVRDRHSDARVGKRTLAVRFGRRGAEWQYLGSWFFCYVLPGILWALGVTGPGPLVTWLTIPFAARAALQLREREGRALNETLGATARLVFLYGASLSLGLSLEPWLT